MNKNKLIISLMILLSVCCAGVEEAQPVVADYSAADAGKWTAHFKSRQELSQFLDGWYLHTDRPGDAEKPMTRFDFVDMFYFHLDRLTNLAAFKLKLKTSEEFYAFVRQAASRRVTERLSLRTFGGMTTTALKLWINWALISAIKTAFVIPNRKLPNENFTSGSAKFMELNSTALPFRTSR
jgi:hypothetical protein